MVGEYTIDTAQMRLWTVHPKYLDPQGLVALWREALLARAVLRGATKGYTHHPQLRRFQCHATPRRALNGYLACVLSEASRRGYSFDPSKVGPARAPSPIVCTSGQLEYEWEHLLRKLRARSPSVYRACLAVARPAPHPLFRIRAGPVEAWERV